jgi:prevent-host-death family protein
MASMSVSDLRAQLRNAMERVEAGEEIEITRDGRVAAVLVHPSRLRHIARTRALRGAERLRQQLEEARRKPWPPTGPGLSTEYADELIRWIRAGRDRKR